MHTRHPAPLPAQPADPGVIGVVAGVGPWAGLDLQRKILAQTVAATDQAYPTVLAVSQPQAIADRTAFLLGETEHNPGVAIAAQVLALQRMGATVVGIPCNTAHAPPVFDAITARLDAAGATIHLLHMLEETIAHIRATAGAVQRVGLLATVGTYRSDVYRNVGGSAELTTLYPNSALQSAVHDAIYNPEDGIKATGAGNRRTAGMLEIAGQALRQRGAQALILGCTELPLAITGATLAGLPVVDPTWVLARALLREAAPAKLRPLTR